MKAHDIPHGRATAELIFTGGRVHTVNAGNDIVEAVGGGRILAVGSTADAGRRHAEPLRLGAFKVMTERAVVRDRAGADTADDGR
jgi:hypothetical protein